MSDQVGKNCSVKTSNNINQKVQNSSIDDIDLPLFQYGFIYKPEIIERIGCVNQRKFQKFKSYSLMIWLSFNIVRYLTSFLISKGRIVPKCYFDFIQSVGGISEFYYLCTILVAISGFSILCTFNLSSSVQFEWLDIVKALKGLQQMRKI